MQVRPFRLLGNANLAKIAHLAQDVLSAWAQAWEVDASVLRVSCMRAWEADVHWGALSWQPAYCAGDKVVWHGHSVGLLSALQAVLFPLDQANRSWAVKPSPIAGRMAEQADRALQSALHTALLNATPATVAIPMPDEDVGRFASGAAVLRIHIGENCAVFVLNPECVQALAPVPDRLPTGFDVPNRLDAMHATPISLPILLGKAEVRLERLMSLAVGDVIRLETAIDQPIDVQGPDGTSLFGAHLGRVEHSVAIEVVRPQQTSTGVKK